MIFDELIQKTYATPQGTIAYWVSPQSQEDASHPWLIFLPGLTADHRLFEKQIEYFINKANVLVWDPPSHGLSRPFALTWTMDDLATWMHAICQQEQITCPILIGQSMGGYTAQVFMELYPSCAKGLVSIDSCSLQRHYYSNWELTALGHTKLMYLSIPWKTLVRLGSQGNATTPYAQNLMRDMMLDYQNENTVSLQRMDLRCSLMRLRPIVPTKSPVPTSLFAEKKIGRDQQNVITAPGKSIPAPLSIGSRMPDTIPIAITPSQ